MKDDYTVVEGETVSKQPADEKAKTEKNAESVQTSSKSTKSRSRADWLARLLAIGALGGAAWLWSQQGQLNAIVEAQNTLNSRLEQLSDQQAAQSKTLADLKKQLSALQETVDSLSTEVDALNEKVLNPANEPIVTKGDLELLQKQLDGLKGQLQNWVQRWQQALQGLQTPPASKGDKGEAATPPALNQLQQQLQQMGQQLGQLFNQLQAPAETSQHENAAPQLPQASGSVDPMTLQQWLLRTNTEWLLTGDVALTRARLHSLEQMVQLSDLPNESKIKLLRTIGQDLAYLDQYGKTQVDARKVLTPLRQWIRTLKPDTKAASHGEDTPRSLSERLKGLVEIRKRDEGLSTPEQLMAFDLTKQRALLLVDQLQWAYTTHNPTLFAQTEQRLRALFKQALPARLRELEAQLAKLPAPQHPQPLKSAEAL